MSAVILTGMKGCISDVCSAGIHLIYEGPTAILKS